MSERLERYDGEHHYELLERALTLWWWGERYLRRMPWMGEQHAMAYEQAIAAGVDHLRQYHTISELCAAYFAVWPPDEEGTLPASRRWVEEVCRATQDPTIRPTVVEDVAYFRRCRELILQAQAGA